LAQPDIISVAAAMASNETHLVVAVI